MNFEKAIVVSIVFHIVFLAAIPHLYQAPALDTPEEKKISLVVLRTPRPSPKPEPAKGTPKTAVKKSRNQKKKRIKPSSPQKQKISAPLQEKAVNLAKPLLPPMPDMVVSSEKREMLSAGEKRTLPEAENLYAKRQLDPLISTDQEKNEASVLSLQKVNKGRNDLLIPASALKEIMSESPAKPTSESLPVSVRRSNLPVRATRRSSGSTLDFPEHSNEGDNQTGAEQLVSGGKPDIPPAFPSGRALEKGVLPAGKKQTYDRMTVSRTQRTAGIEHLLTEIEDQEQNARKTGSSLPGKAGGILSHPLPKVDELYSRNSPDESLPELSITNGERSSGAMSQGVKGRVQVDPGEVEFARKTITTRPRLLHWVAPSYPEWAERMGKEGKVRLQLEVSKTGKVENVSVVENTAGEVLATAARESAYRWKFEPVFIDGVPVDVVVYKTIYFILEHGK